MDVAIFVGARPGFIKSWSIFWAFMNQGIVPTVVATGQHHDILKQQQLVLAMPISHWLVEHQPSLPLAQLYGLIYERAWNYLGDLKPDAVFVNGDTTSALAVSMAAFNMQIPVAHIEAGLRSGNLQSPYPEEFNRIAIDSMSTYLFAPTWRAADICRAINPRGRICVTGNTVIDALNAALQIMTPEPYGMDPFLVLDMHRRETDTHGMDRIAEVVLRQANEHGLKVYWPAHPSPKVQAVAMSFAKQGMKVIQPLNYFSFINLMQNAELILSDSGGVIEEAITIGTPTLQLRDHTDRQEAVEGNFSWLSTTNPQEVERQLRIAIPYAPSWKEWMKGRVNPYGNGDAGHKSVDFFLREFNDVG